MADLTYSYDHEPRGVVRGAAGGLFSGGVKGAVVGALAGLALTGVAAIAVGGIGALIGAIGSSALAMGVSSATALASVGFLNTLTTFGTFGLVSAGLSALAGGVVGAGFGMPIGGVMGGLEGHAAEKRADHQAEIRERILSAVPALSQPQVPVVPASVAVAPEPMAVKSPMLAAEAVAAATSSSVDAPALRQIGPAGQWADVPASHAAALLERGYQPKVLEGSKAAAIEAEMQSPPAAHVTR